MKALSLGQPWATAIARGVKRIETRDWSTDYRGKLLIHASKHWDNEQREFASIEQRVGRLPASLPLGAFVAIVELVDVLRVEEVTVGRIELLYGNYSAGRFAWVLANARPLPQPVPYAGQQKLFDVPDEVVEGMRT